MAAGGHSTCQFALIPESRKEKKVEISGINFDYSALYELLCTNSDS